jgi:hypothetical protein
VGVVHGFVGYMAAENGGTFLTKHVHDQHERLKVGLVRLGLIAEMSVEAC